MSKQSRENKAYEAWIRLWPCAVAVVMANDPTTAALVGKSGACSGPVEFSHLEHKGMGGSKFMMSMGNGCPLCARHHRNEQVGLHGLGIETFQKFYALPLIDLCLRFETYYPDNIPFVEERPIPGISLDMCPRDDLVPWGT